LAGIEFEIALDRRGHQNTPKQTKYFEGAGMLTQKSVDDIDLVNVLCF
jgi:hypothetical protein